MLNQYVVVKMMETDECHIHKIPLKGNVEILTKDHPLTPETVHVVAMLLKEAQAEGWKYAFDAVKNYCDRVGGNKHVG